MKRKTNVRPSRLIKKENTYSLFPGDKTIDVIEWNEDGVYRRRIRNTKVNREKITKLKGEPKEMQELIGKNKFLFWA